MQRSEQNICRITTPRLKNSEQIFPVEGKRGKHNRRRGVCPRSSVQLKKECLPIALSRTTGYAEKSGGTNQGERDCCEHQAASLKADASSTICDFEGLKNQMLRTFCPGNVFEDHTETSKVLFVLRISQKTKWNFKLCTDTHSPAPKHSGR